METLEYDDETPIKEGEFFATIIGLNVVLIS